MRAWRTRRGARHGITAAAASLLAFAIGVGVGATAATAQEPRPMVVGGEVDDRTDVGWIAALVHRGRYTCAGSLVTRSFVLTAAHCVEGSRPGEWSVRLDSKDRKLGGIDRSVRRVLVYPSFRWWTGAGDVALLRLEEPVPEAELAPAALVSRGTRWVGERAYIAGWGLTSAASWRVPTLLHSAVIPIRRAGPCAALYPWFKPRLMVCAGNRKSDTCSGDSGGPLARQLGGEWYVVGVTSFGTWGCNRPGAYAWVGAGPVNRWLRERVGG